MTKTTGDTLLQRSFCTRVVSRTGSLNHRLLCRVSAPILAAAIFCTSAGAETVVPLLPQVQTTPAGASDGADLPVPPAADVPVPDAPFALPDFTNLEPGSTLAEKMAEQATILGKQAEVTHDRLERGILNQVIRLDDFFGKPNPSKDLRTAYLLRWRNSARLQQGSGLGLGSTLNANLELSRINERLQLAISGNDQPDQLAPSLPEDPGNPGFDRTFRNARIVNTELRYQLVRSPETNLFLGAGFDLTIPPQFFLRARYQRLYRLSPLYLFHFGETFFVKNPDGFGETTEFAIERSLGPKTLLREANSATVSQEIGAIEWGSELSLLHELSPRSALTVTSGIYGNTGIDDWITNYRVQLLYRRNFLRSWLFYELEPQITWPRQDDGTFKTNYAFTVRLEVVFQGRERAAVKDR